LPLPIPTLDQIVERITSDIATALIDLDPSISEQWALALAQSLGARVFDLYLYDQQSVDQQFPQTAMDEFLDRWLQYQDTARLTATESSGPLTVTGTPTTVLPISSVFVTGDVSLITQAEVTIQTSVVSVTLIRVGTTVTATASSDHGLATGNSPTIAGADQAEYNGTFPIIASTNLIFQYEIVGSPTTPATGTITATLDSAVVEVESQDTGADQNLLAGAQVNAAPVIAGIDSAAFVRPEAITGGTDDETEADAVARLLGLRANPGTPFNPPTIIKEVIENVDGVTRVFVKRVYDADLQSTSVGDVSVFFLRDNDSDIIPDASEIADVRTFIEDELLPANTGTSQLFVKAPIPTAQAFTFSAISPDNSSMRANITANLQAFFADSVTFEQIVTEDQYRTAITLTQDDTGTQLASFTLTDPTTDIDPGLDGIVTLGLVTF